MATRVNLAFGQLPLYFVENHGQVDRRAAYYVQGRDKAIYFTAGGVWYAFHGETSQHWLRLDFLGAQPARPAGQDQTEAIISYFKGAPGEWQAGLPTYAGVVYRDLWPGIDLTYRGTTNRLKYEFLVWPGADPADIRLAYRGASSVVLNSQGQLEVETPLGGFVDERPTAYQVRGGARTPVAVAFDLGALPEGDGTTVRYGFHLGKYDRSRPLVIDPASLVYAGYLGGAGDDRGEGVAVDGAGNVYVTGWTSSDQASFPVAAGPDLSHNGGTYDAFVAKLNAAGTALVYAGYLGGSSNDRGYGIAVDSAGNAYLAGYTASPQTSFPVVAGPDLTFNGTEDAFVAKLDAAGTALVYAGYIGGAGADNGRRIAVDGAGNAYVSGSTSSNQASFPDGDGLGGLASFDAIYAGGVDGFVARVNATGSALDYAGYVGGTGNERADGIAVDGAGSAYVTGPTSSNQTSFPVVAGPDLTFNGSEDAFVAKLSPAGTGLVYAGYIGGAGQDVGIHIAVDGAGSAYLTGYTFSDQASFPDGDGLGALASFDNTHNSGQDTFVAKLNADGTGLEYAGYLGGAGGNDEGWSIAVDALGRAYVAGGTSSTEASFPDGDGFGALPGFDNTYNGGSYDGFVARVNAAGTGLNYAGYIGGGGADRVFSVALDSLGNAYATGWVESGGTSFPDGDGFGALPSFDNTHNGGGVDAFVAKISFNTPPVANPNAYATDEDTPLAVAAPGLLGDDADADNDSLAAVKESDPVTGTLASGADGSLVYTPTLDYNGVVTFTYHVTDGLASSNTAVVTVTVSPVNDAPTLSDIPDQQVQECDALGPISFTVGDVDDDVDGLDLGAASSDPALVPVSSISFGGGGVNRSLTITPTLGLTGTASISITVGDGTDTSSDAFLLTVDPRSCYFHLPIIFKSEVMP